MRWTARNETRPSTANGSLIDGYNKASEYGLHFLKVASNKQFYRQTRMSLLKNLRVFLQAIRPVVPNLFKKRPHFKRKCNQRLHVTPFCFLLMEKNITSNAENK